MGIVEGLTEFLPISSTAHLIFTGELLRIPASEFLKTFEISIQLGAILAVVIIYSKRVWNNLGLIWKLAAAFIPTSIIGLIFYKIVKNFLMESNLVIAISLLLGGIIIILFESQLGRPPFRIPPSPLPHHVHKGPDEVAQVLRAQLVDLDHCGLSNQRGQAAAGQVLELGKGPAGRPIYCIRWWQFLHVWCGVVSAPQGRPASCGALGCIVCCLSPTQYRACMPGYHAPRHQAGMPCILYRRVKTALARTRPSLQGPLHQTRGCARP